MKDAMNAEHRSNPNYLERNRASLDRVYSPACLRPPGDLRPRVKDRRPTRETNTLEEESTNRARRRSKRKKRNTRGKELTMDSNRRTRRTDHRAITDADLQAPRRKQRAAPTSQLLKYFLMKLCNVHTKRWGGCKTQPHYS